MSVDIKLTGVISDAKSVGNGRTRYKVEVDDGGKYTSKVEFFTSEGFAVGDEVQMAFSKLPWLKRDKETNRLVTWTSRAGTEYCDLVWSEPHMTFIGQPADAMAAEIPF